MTETFVKSITHLKDMPRAERALPMLQRVTSLVKPIMRKHGWVLPVLVEFFPDSPNLLDVNGGEQILLRLRLPYSPDTFYEEDHVTRTMLHELTHNVHGPHDEKFYQFLAGLEDEYDALRRSGYAGEGFFSPGHRLGGAGIARDLPPHLVRLKALEAAEKRRRSEALTKGGGRLELGPRELAARAAERRKRDESACGSGSVALREAAKAAKASVETKVVIDLTKEEDDTPQASGSRQPTSLGNSSNSSADGQWTCPLCTLINKSLALQCDACLAERPVDTSVVGWACLTCGERDIPHNHWSCRFCGAIKMSS
ncbi:WLM domain-containing protein [Melanogaster broomeanus]|nr:WLM domain-containing protein [Melanogaster broomeanus]